MSEPEVFISPTLTFYIRSKINKAGLFYAPAPILEVLRNTAISIDIQVKDLSSDKAIYDLDGAFIRFVARKSKYPIDSTDIFVDVDTDGPYVSIVNASDGTFTIDIEASDLNVTPSEYWYDIQIWKNGAPSELIDMDIRQPLQKFIVLT